MKRACQKRKYNNKKKNETSEKAVDEKYENDLVLCLLTTKIKKEKVKKFGLQRMLTSLWRQVCHAPSMVTLFSFMKNTWVSDSCAPCHITNNDTVFFMPLTSTGQDKKALGTCWR